MSGPCKTRRATSGTFRATYPLASEAVPPVVLPISLKRSVVLLAGLNFVSKKLLQRRRSHDPEACLALGHAEPSAAAGPLPCIASLSQSVQGAEVTRNLPLNADT